MTKDRNIALKIGDIETTRYYMERLKFEFDNEIMSENFGNACSLWMFGELICMEIFFS